MIESLRPLSGVGTHMPCKYNFKRQESRVDQVSFTVPGSSLQLNSPLQIEVIDCVRGVKTPPCGVPQFRSIVVPSSFTMGARSHLSMYNSAHLHVMCFRTARSKSSWSMLSNRPLMSNSKTQSHFQHRSRVTPTASSADLFGLYP